MASKNHYIRTVSFGIAIGIGFSIAFLLGFFVREITILGSIDSLGSPSLDSNYPVLNEVQGLLDQVYLRELPDQSVREYAAIRGMLETLGDPTTFFIDPPVAQSESQALAGTYGGIGVQVKRIDSGEFAIFPFEDAPAYEAGLRDNDILTAINDQLITGEERLDVIDQSLRGEVAEGSGVKVSIRRNQTQLDEFIEFAVINIPSVVSRVLDEDLRVGYLQILRFTSRTPDELVSEATTLLDRNISALIVDLRDNSGGLLVESIEVADEFLQDGTVVIEQARNSEDIYEATSGGTIVEIPLAILVNNRTASASELVAGALTDNGRGILIGQPTFGKGTVQQIFSLSDDSSIHITSAEWLTPNRKTIASNGLVPDIEMIPDENGRDIEMGEAIRYLQTLLDEQAK